jgi:hypothetical protein
MFYAQGLGDRKGDVNCICVSLRAMWVADIPALGGHLCV